MAITAIRKMLKLDTPTTDELPKEWPLPGQKSRIDDYARYRAIWEGDHLVGLSEMQVADRCGQYIPVNLARIIVTIPADFLFGEEFELTFPDGTDEGLQEQCKEIFKRSDFRAMFYESKLDSGIDGDAVILVERDEEGLARFRVQPACDWCPDANPDNRRDIKAHWIGWKRTLTIAGKEKDFLRLIKHEKGMIRNYLVEIGKDGKLGVPVDLALAYPDAATRPPVSVETGLKDFALEHIPNWRTSREYNGRAEYKDLDGMFASLDGTVTQSDSVMQKHSDPILGLPKDVYAAEKARVAQVDGQPLIDKRNLEIVALGENGEKPEYITWDGNVADNLSYIDKIVNLIALVSETAPQLLNQGDWGNDMSGKALKVLLIRTLAKVNRSRLYYSEAIPNLAVKAMILEGVKPEVALKAKPVVKWPDGLPQDVEEAIDSAIKKKDAGIQTTVGAIMEAEDITEDAAKQKAKEIEDERDEAQRKEDASLVNTFMAKKKFGAQQ